MPLANKCYLVMIKNNISHFPEFDLHYRLFGNIYSKSLNCHICSSVCNSLHVSNDSLISSNMIRLKTMVLTFHRLKDNHV